MTTDTSINPNTAARVRWETYWLIDRITVKPVREAVAEIVGALESVVALPGYLPPVVICEINAACLPRNGITIDYFVILLERTLARILQTVNGSIRLLPCTKDDYLLLEYTP